MTTVVRASVRPRPGLKRLVAIVLAAGALLRRARARAFVATASSHRHLRRAMAPGSGASTAWSRTRTRRPRLVYPRGRHLVVSLRTKYRRQFAGLNAIQCRWSTPGDNSGPTVWKLQGSYAPLERLALLRATFFANPARSLGADHATQVAGRGPPSRVRDALGCAAGSCSQPCLVGSENAASRSGCAPADDAEVRLWTRRSPGWKGVRHRAARFAPRRGARHAATGISRVRDPSAADRCSGSRADHAFPGPVVLIRRLTDNADRAATATGEVLPNLAHRGVRPPNRMVRVVVDSVAGRVVR
jgi:hypothetical protein